MNRKDAGIILVTAVSIAMICFLFFGMYDVIESYSKRSASGTEEEATDEKELCIVSGCTLEHMRGSLYCRKHICLKSGCTEKAVFDTHYCEEHMLMSINSEPSNRTLAMLSKYFRPSFTKVLRLPERNRLAFFDESAREFEG